MLCDSIRRYGLSDSAAAEQQGMSTSTLSRWKELHPEIGIELKRARQEIRTFHLQNIMNHAAAEDGKSLRASMWILERLYPGDYSPRMKDRLSYLSLEDRLHDKEAHEALAENFERSLGLCHRLVMTFFTAKRLLGALHMAVQQHENSYGVLEVDINKRLRTNPAMGMGRR